MPTVEVLKERGVSIKKKIAEKKDSLDPKKMRAMKKRLKRAQRGARSLEARAKQFAEKAKKKKAEG